MSRSSLFLLLCLLTVCHCPAQVVFTAGGNNNLGLFQQNGSTVSRINTGANTHNAMAMSRDGRFITYAAVDTANMGGTIIPSSDLFEYDRSTSQTRRIVDNTSSLGGFFNVVSSGVSLDNQFVAVGTELFLRFGIQSNSSGRVLEIYDRATRSRVSDVTAFRGGAVSDAFNTEFSAVSWSPRAPSFITPLYIPVTSQRGTPANLTAIVRFDRNASGQWVIGQTLSAPAYLDLELPPAAVLQSHPGYSPSGLGIAYFSNFYRDALTGSAGAQCSVVVANADGSSPRVLTTFNPGFLPTGLTWSADGTQIIVSIAPQLNAGTGFLYLAVLEQSIIRAVSTSNGSVTQLTGIGGGLNPQTALNAAPATQDLSGIRPSLTPTSDGRLLLRASGLSTGVTYRLESSSTLLSFPESNDFTGAQFATGILIPISPGKKYFRIRSL